MVLLTMVFFLFIWAVLKLFLTIKSYINPQEITLDRPLGNISSIPFEDLSSLLYVIVAFAIIWIYAVLDAFWTGRKIEKEAKREADAQ